MYAAIRKMPAIEEFVLLGSTVVYTPLSGSRKQKQGVATGGCTAMEPTNREH